MREFSPDAVRRIAVAAQGFGVPRPATSGRRALAGVLRSTRLLQIDSVSAAVRAHYAPVFARIGPYDRHVLDDAAWTDTARSPRMLVEYWAHEAAFLPVQDWPLMRWRMETYAHGRWGGARSVIERSPRLVDDVLAVVAERGPSSARDLELALDRHRPGPKGPWWDHSDVKVVCEQLFATGVLSVARREQFVRLYDLVERVLPAEVVARRVPEEDAVRELVANSARAMGIATAVDLRDHYRLSAAQTSRAVADLVEEGTLVQVGVRDRPDAMYLHRDARVPRATEGSALLCPFDPLVFGRARTERIFDFHYRIEIYTPAPKRRYGYYVFPFLLDDRLVGRVDLRADRSTGVLTVPGAFVEAFVDRPDAENRVAPALAQALEEMALWLGLERFEIGERGNLAAALSAAERRRN